MGYFCTAILQKKLMISEGILVKNLIPIYNSLDYDKQILVREKLKKNTIYQKLFKNDYPVLIFVGRIMGNKKLDQVLHAMKEAKDEGFKMNFILVGKEIDHNNLREVIQALKLTKNVHFYGECFDEETLGSLIFNAKVCVSPGIVGLTAIHSLMYGTPVVSHGDCYSQAPEFEVIEDGINGGVF